MKFIEWTQDLSVGVTQFDEQHKRLVDLVNDVNAAMHSGKGREVVGKTLSALADYTVNHFAAEEKLFAEHGYPEAVAHKKKHDDLVSEVVKLQGRLEKGEMITMEVMNFLKKWLTTHILGDDKAYSTFFQSKGVP